jgi:two-component system nitrogen regulation sensor histidine kinase NtrY
MQRWADRLDGEVRDTVATGCEAIIAQVGGLKELVDAFRLYARMPGVEPRPSSVSQIAREVGSLYHKLQDALEVRVELPSSEVFALVDAVLLRQALVNLLDNSVDAMAGSGTIDLSLRTEGSDLILEVADTGVGLPTEDVTTLLQPLFSTKARGSGIGLALVNRIVTDHGGYLELENREPRGAAVRIILTDALVTEAASEA